MAASKETGSNQNVPEWLKKGNEDIEGAVTEEVQMYESANYKKMHPALLVYC
jgi:hypothetical protein